MKQNVTLTYHAEEERMERIAYIAVTAEFGEVVRTKEEHDFHTDATLLELTTTGVIIVRNAKTKTLVTMYMASYKQATWLCDGDMPDVVKRAITRNIKRGWFAEQQKMRG